MAHFTNSQAAAGAVNAGAISQRAATLLSQANPTGLVDYAEVRRTFDDVRMSCFIIDASGSMEPCRDAVIQRQQGMVNMLRKSSKCRKNALYIGQWLFAASPGKLNPYTLLNVNGGDGVVLLDQARYSPKGGTALYKTVFQVLQEIAANLAFSYSKAISSTFTIAVMTDGDDTEGGVDPNDIKAIVQELKGNGYLVSSLVIGIEHPKLSQQRIVEIKDTLGFDDAIFVGQSDSEIRRAFDLASQSALKG